MKLIKLIIINVNNYKNKANNFSKILILKTMKIADNSTIKLQKNLILLIGFN